jgi:preprotein translocase subunit YajC
MFSLVPDLYAMSTQSGQDPGFMGQIILFGAIFLIFFMLVIRPQQKKAKKHRELLSSVQKGDQVVTASGISGKVNKVFDEKDYLLLEIADKTVIQIQKSQIGGVIQSKAQPAVEAEQNK